MSVPESASESVRISVENLGGIDSATVELPPGVTVLTGRNATNRTSLLRAVMAALGSDDATLKGDAEKGSATLSIDGQTYTRRFERDGGPGAGADAVSVTGDPYLDDPTEADLFALLLGSNEARRAVHSGADLRDLVMRPVDTAAINAEIDRLEDEKRRLENEIDDLDDLEQRRERLVAERADVGSDLESVEADLEDERAALAEADASIEAVEDHQAAVEETLGDIEAARSGRSEVRSRLEGERDSLSALREEREDLTAKRADLPDAPAERLDTIASELDRLRAHKRSLEATINQLGQVIQFNESVVEGDDDFLDELATDDDGDLTDQLLPEDDEVVCWTCGSPVTDDAIEDTLETLRSLRSARVTDRQEVAEEIDDLRDEQRELEDVRDERDRVERRLAEIDEEIDRREATVDDLEAEIDDLDAEIDDLEETLEQRQERDFSEVLERQQRVNELEFEQERLTDRRTALADEIEEIDDALGTRAELQDRIEDVTDRLETERTRIDRLEADIVETFNEHMESVRSLLEYENVERIWLERRERDAGRGGGERTFDLHVIRDSESGAAYEDSLETLSESERVVAGLVFALAGYLAHEVYERVPFVLLDSLEAIDAERIASLVEYFAEYAPYLVIALLEEDATAVDGAAERVEMS
jgi:DNA repair exonuclease SbcCD ATPase subunit